MVGPNHTALSPSSFLFNCSSSLSSHLADPASPAFFRAVVPSWHQQLPFFLLPLLPFLLLSSLFAATGDRPNAGRNRGARATTMATGRSCNRGTGRVANSVFPCYNHGHKKLHPVDKKASTRQRNTGNVTTVLTKSFNPQMKKLQNKD